MQIQNATITRLIERIGEHYRNNISNRFIRPVLLQLSFDNQAWDLIENMTKQGQTQDIRLDEVYRQIIAAARFVATVRRDLGSGLRNRISSGDTSGSDKVLMNMAVNNFTSNLRVFADLVNELYIKLVEADKTAAKGRAPLYTTLPELSSIGRLLVDS